MRSIRFACALVVALVAAATPAIANDGVIELNQSKILAAGGFPYQITASGSYVLTSNLTLGGGANALTLAASGITLDLNGFSIVGSGLGCLAASDRAIAATGSQSQIVIKNGTIRGFCFGILLGTVTELTIERVNLSTTGNQSVNTGANAILRGNHFTGPNSSVTCPSIVVDTSFHGSAGNNGVSTASCAKSNVIGNF